MRRPYLVGMAVALAGAVGVCALASAADEPLPQPAATPAVVAPKALDAKDKLGDEAIEAVVAELADLAAHGDQAAQREALQQLFELCSYLGDQARTEQYGRALIALCNDESPESVALRKRFEKYLHDIDLTMDSQLRRRQGYRIRYRMPRRQYDEAMKLAREMVEAARLPATKAEALWFLADASEAAKRTDVTKEALTALQAQATDAGEKRKILNRLARCLSPEEATATYRDLINTAAPGEDCGGEYVALSSALASMGRREDAKAALREYIEKHPAGQYAADVRLRLGSLEMKDNPAQGAKVLAGVKEIVPESHPLNMTATYHQAEALAMEGKPAEAAEAYKAFIYEHPFSPQATLSYHSLAMLEMKQKLSRGSLQTQELRDIANLAMRPDPRDIGAKLEAFAAAHKSRAVLQKLYVGAMEEMARKHQNDTVLALGNKFAKEFGTTGEDAQKVAYMTAVAAYEKHDFKTAADGFTTFL